MLADDWIVRASSRSVGCPSVHRRKAWAGDAEPFLDLSDFHRISICPSPHYLTTPSSLVMSLSSPAASLLSGRRRPGDGNRLKRTASEISRSSSSSEIQVTSLPPRSTNQPTVHGGIPGNPYTARVDENMELKIPQCWVVNGHILVIKLRPQRNGNTDGIKLDDGERNARGTYSREYALQHPEIKWTHRGQGRYLPAEEVRREPAPMPERRSRYVSFRLEFCRCLLDYCM